jgi:hypothetical protein
MAENNHIFLSLTNSAAGEEAAFNSWYDQHHLPEMLHLLPEFVSGQRYVAEPERQRAGTQLNWRYLCLYQVRTPNPAAVFPTLSELRRTSVQLPPVIRNDSHGWLFEAVGDKQTRSKPAAQGARHLFFALTNAVKGEEENFARWYDEVHLPEVLTHLPDFVSGQRYRLSPHQRKETAPAWEYLAIYEIASDDVAATHAKTPAIARQLFSPLESMAPGHTAWTWSPLGLERKRA